MSSANDDLRWQLILLHVCRDCNSNVLAGLWKRLTLNLRSDAIANAISRQGFLGCALAASHQMTLNEHQFGISRIQILSKVTGSLEA